ncbi:MAG: Lrp/AsnC family transcriptional regulator [Acidimicrobiales bacterium]|nr:Lrp/AsnC family transcriptional regulator [Hyphomonadaceae bacterium]RZV42237.1 MAG: Lrp/AsnC family transcriptional regulator [Acidimicrobiales bacterium]
MSDQNFEFSDLDRSIITILKKDGRTSNQKIADMLNVTTSMVATRIRRMEQAKAMKVVAVSDFSAFDYNVLLPIGVDVKGRRANDVAADLAKLEEVAVVQLVSGRHDIEILVTLPSMDDMSGFLLEKLSKIKGIRNLDPSFAVDIIKYDFDVAPI